MDKRLQPCGIMAVDIGNTSIKVYREVDGGGEISLSCRRVETLEAAESIRKNEGIERVAFLSTRHLSEDERGVVEENDWWEFTSTVPVPMDVRYDRSTLGPDRLAAALGGWREFYKEGCLVVDSGTALTLDLITPSGEYRGGNISPGLRLRFRSLADYTSKSPLVDNVENPVAFGENTVEAITAGVVNGMVYEIAGTYAVARKEFCIDNILLTGGDIDLLHRCLVSRLDALFLHHDGDDGRRMEKCFRVDPDIVGKGLIEAYKYNHE